MIEFSPEAKKLKPKQRSFIAYYFECGMNASAAARKAGYTNRANTAASQLMSNNVIKQEIDRITRESSTISPAEVMARFTQHARADIWDVTDDAGRFSMAKAIDNGKTGIIRSVTHTTTTFKGVETVTVKVELHDVQKALQLLGKELGLFVEKVEHTGKDGGPIKTYMTWSPDDWDTPGDGP